MRMSSTARISCVVVILMAGGLGCAGNDSTGNATGAKDGSAPTTGSGGATMSGSGGASGGSGGSRSTGSGGTTTAATGGAPSTGGASGNPGAGGSGGSGRGGTGGGGLSGTGAVGVGPGRGGTSGSDPAGRSGTSSGGAGGNATTKGSGPPMGWASWNSFAAKINYNVIKQQADAMVSSGLSAAGYQYVNIDEGWWQGTRDASGNITVDTSEWPGGMQAIADYIHGLGLKAGIYTDAGKDGCGYYYPTGRDAAPHSGAEGHYDEDFLQFSKWGFDFVKVDWCGGDHEKLDAKTAYQGIADAIKKATAQTGRPLALSVCNWGNQSPWNWAPAISTMWRTSQDIIYYGNQASLDKVFSNFDSAQHPTAQSPQHYNDPDMLIVGMSGFAAAQNRTHMALWAISGAPLLAGNNIATMNSDTKSVLTNSEVIAIDQDPLAKQGTRVSDSSGLQVYSKELSGTGRRAVLLLNRNSSAGMITVRFADIGLGATASVRNVWMAMDLGTKTTSYGVSVPAHDSVLLTIVEAAAAP